MFQNIDFIALKTDYIMFTSVLQCSVYSRHVNVSDAIAYQYQKVKHGMNTCATYLKEIFQRHVTLRNYYIMFIRVLQCSVYSSHVN